MLTTAEYTALLKEIYPDTRVVELLYTKRPALGILRKDTTMGGERTKIPVVYGDPTGRSHSAALSKANSTESKQKAFFVDTINDYGYCSLAGEVIDRSRNDAGSFIRALRMQMDRSINNIANNASTELFRNSGGSRGQILSISTDTVTLARKRDIVNFSPGMVLQVSATDGTSGAVRAGTVTVESVDRSAGTITATAAWSAGIGAVAVNDFIFVEGDFGEGLSGFDAWLPATAPGATLFFGVDRSLDPTRLGGIRVDASSAGLGLGTHLEAYRAAYQEATVEEGTPDIVFCSVDDLTKLMNEIDSQVNHVLLSGDSSRGGQPNTIPLSYQGFGLKVAGLPGVVFVQDPKCPVGTAYMVEKDTWTFGSMGEAFRMWDYDGQVLMRESTGADELTFQLVSRHQLYCNAPGRNVRITLPY